MEINKMFDHLKDGVTFVANKTVEKSTELYKRTKISLDVSSLNSMVEKDYKEIGKIIYEGYKTDDLDSDKVSEICKRLDEKFEQINKLKIQSAEYKEIKLCPHCGCEIMPDSEYCAKCGEKIK